MHAGRLEALSFEVRYNALSTRSTVIFITMMEAQVRTRRNAQEAKDYLTDLLKWEKEQKQKDEKLRRKATVSKREPSTGSNPSQNPCIRAEVVRYNTLMPLAFTWSA